MDKKITVCLLNESFPPVIDGVANVVLNYADNIHRTHGSAIVAVPHYPDTVDDYPYRVIRYPSIDTTKSFGYRTGIPFTPGVIKELTKSNIDIIHTHCPFISTLIARMLRSYTNVPIVLTYHTKFDMDIKNAVELGFLQSAAIKFIISNVEACDEVWTVSEGAGENLRSLGYKGDIRVMENGVDFAQGCASVEATQALAAEYGLDENTPVFLFVGRMMWYKGIRIILEGLSQAKARGTRFKMFFVGSGADIEEIKQLAGFLKLTEDCIFTGIVQDRQRLRTLFSSANMFLFPSTFDTNGIVVREAAACGLASVLIKDSCAAEGITDGHNGVLIDENAQALSEAVIHAAANLEHASAMGHNAMNELYLSWAQAVGQAYRRYPDIIAKYQNTPHTHIDFQDKKLFKLAADIESALKRLKTHTSHRMHSVGARHRTRKTHKKKHLK